MIGTATMKTSQVGFNVTTVKIQGADGLNNHAHVARAVLQVANKTLTAEDAWFFLG